MSEPSGPSSRRRLLGTAAALCSAPLAATWLASVAQAQTPASAVPAHPPQRRMTTRPIPSTGEALPVATREVWQAATGLAMIDGIGATELLHIFIASAGAVKFLRGGSANSSVTGACRRSFRAREATGSGAPR